MQATWECGKGVTGRQLHVQTAAPAQTEPVLRQVSQCSWDVRRLTWQSGPPRVTAHLAIPSCSDSG